MQVRVINVEDDQYELLSYYDIENFDLLYKTIDYMQKNEVNRAIGINTEDLVDTECDGYYVKYAQIVFPNIGGDTLPYMAIYVTSSY